MTHHARVEIVERSRHGGHVRDTDPIAPNAVLIDGHDVGYLTEDGVAIDAIDPDAPNGGTVVTLRLLPSHVTIRHSV